MAHVYTGVQAHYAEFDVSGDANRFEPDRGFVVVERRAYNSSSVLKEPGLRQNSATLGGSMSYEDPGTSFFNNIGTKVPFSAALAGSSPSEGDDSIFFNALSGRLENPIVQGDLHEFTLMLDCDGDMPLGVIAGVGAKTATGNGSSQQLGAVADGQTLYACMHVTAVSGTNPTLDVIIESDDDTGFASGVTKLTFTQATAATSEFLSLKPVGGLTDDWYRAAWTIGGTDTPTFTISISIGIS